MLLHPDGKPRWIRPSGSIRYRLDVYEPRPIEIRAGDRIRWTRNDKKLRDKASQPYTIPGSDRTHVAAETIRGWIRLYRYGGP